MRSRTIAMSVAIIGLMAASFNSAYAKAADDEVSVSFRYFLPQISGSIADGTDYASYRTGEYALDFNHDLGLSNAHAPEVRANYRNIQLDYVGFRSSVSGFALEGPIRHNNHTYKGNLDTDLDMDYLAVDYKKAWHERKNASSSYWTAGVKYIRMSATSTGINASDQPQSDSDSASGIVPSIGIGANWQSSTAPRWQGGLALSGMPLGKYGHLADFEANVQYNPTPRWNVSAGWRVINMKLKKDEKKVEYIARGPFFSIGYSF